MKYIKKNFQEIEGIKMATINYKCLFGQVYEDFIKTAVARSDSLSISINWPRKISLPDNFEEHLLSVGLSKDEIMAMREKMEMQSKLDNQLFSNQTIPFLEELKPFLTESQSFSERKHTYLLSSTSEIIPILLKPNSIFMWGFPYFPDDLSFAINGKYWFMSESHENSAVLFPDNETDYKFWCDLGVVFCDSFDYSIDVMERPTIK